MLTLLKQRRMQWLRHVTCMEDGCIAKDLLYGELASGRRPTGKQLRFKNACKCDLKQMNIDINTWEAAAADRSAWRCKVRKGLQQFQDELKRQAEENRLQRSSRPLSDTPASVFICARRSRDCHSRVNLHCHSRRCIQGTTP